MDPIAATYPADIATRYATYLAQWKPTVADARRILAPWRDRLIRIELDDGQYAAATLYGLYLDVVHCPQVGYSLVLRNLSPESDPNRRRHLRTNRQRQSIPLALIRRMPDAFGFLVGPPEGWLTPPHTVRCNYRLCGAEGIVGRFCVRCGHLARRPGAGLVSARFLGPAFVAFQQAVRDVMKIDPSAGVQCRCGAVVWRGDRYCGKCGTPIEEAA